MIRADLSLGFHQGLRPPDGCRDHSAKVLQLTLLRGCHTRAATALESSAHSKDDEIVAELLRCFNGDWRHPYVEHYCFEVGCCSGGIDSCVAKMVSLVTAAMLDRVGERVPSTHRWHTFGPALEVQCLGLLLHNILGRLGELGGRLPNAVAAVAGAEAADGSMSAFVEYRAKKDRKSRAFLVRRWLQCC
jgi:hypothetical protein